MKKKKKVPEQIFCTCGSKAKGIKKKKYYLLICKECNKKFKYKDKRAYQDDIYNILSIGNINPVKLIAICTICKNSMYHNYNYQFCMTCRTIKDKYK